MTNQTILAVEKALYEQSKKADTTIGDFDPGVTTGAGGVLNDEQAARFIRKAIEVPTILRDVRTVEMFAPTRQINKIGIGQRILKPGTEGTGLSEANKTVPTTEQLTLTTTELMAECHITYDALEDQIERGNVRAQGVGGGPSGPNAGGVMQTIIDLLAERAAFDLEEWALNGDNTSTVYTGAGADPADALLATNANGWMKLIQAGGNVVDAASSVLSEDIFMEVHQTLPKRYRRNLASLRHFVGSNDEIRYRRELAQRATGLGDSMIMAGTTPMAYGVPVVPCHSMIEAGQTDPPTAPTPGTGSRSYNLTNAGKALYTDPNNLIFGVQRRITFEYDKDIRARKFIIVLTIRCATQVEETEAAVVTNNLADPTVIA